MNKKERDELLIRLDEKTANIYKLTERQEQHLERLNSTVSKHEKRITRSEVVLYFVLAGTAVGGSVAKILGVI